MQAVVDWIKSIAYYVIIVSVFQGILPDNKYKKYVQLFTGLVLVLLILSPIVKLTGQEQTMASLVMSQAEEILNGDFAGEDTAGQTTLFVEAEIYQMVGEWGYEVVQCRLSLDAQGQICRMNLVIQEKTDGSIQTVAPVMQPQISLRKDSEDSAAEESAEATAVLTELLAQQYGLESSQIIMKIQ